MSEEKKGGVSAAFWAMVMTNKAFRLGGNMSGAKFTAEMEGLQPHIDAVLDDLAAEVCARLTASRGKMRAEEIAKEVASNMRLTVRSLCMYPSDFMGGGDKLVAYLWDILRQELENELAEK